MTTGPSVGVGTEEAPYAMYAHDMLMSMKFPAFAAFSSGTFRPAQFGPYAFLPRSGVASTSQVHSFNY
jgi:hypothetical protein